MIGFSRIALRVALILVTLALPVIATSSLAAPTPAAQVAELGRGLNVLGYDPIWDDAAKARFQPRHYARIVQGGFHHLRINLQAFLHRTPEGRLDPRWLATLDDVVRRATAAGLMVILDEHDGGPCAHDVTLCHRQLLDFWREIAPHFRKAPPSVLFEILNEPSGALTPAVWNGLLVEALQVIRGSNPTRTVVIGPGDYNSFKALDSLVLPERDRNIIVTVHDYEPFPFTHQGASWVTPSRVGLTGITWGTPAEHAAVETAFDGVAAWSRAHHRPILLGEFGAYDRGEMASRVAWTTTVARAAEARGFAWSYWQFDSDFLAFDMARDDWIHQIHDALVPPRQHPRP